MNGHILLRWLCDARGGRPVPAFAADPAAGIKIVEGDELPRELVMIGSERLGKKCEPRITVAFLEVAEHLVIGAVLLQDVDDVVDARAKKSHFFADGALRGGFRPMVVLRHLARQRGKLLRSGHWKREQSSPAAQENVFVRRIAGETAAWTGVRRVAAVAGNRPSGADAVRDVERAAVAAHAEACGVPAGGDEAEEAAGGGIFRFVVIVLVFL